MRRIQLAIILLLLVAFAFLPFWANIASTFPKHSGLPFLILISLLIAVTLRLRFVAQLHSTTLIICWVLVYFAGLLSWLYVQGSDLSAYGQSRLGVELAGSTLFIYLAHTASVGIHQVKDTLIELGLYDMPRRSNAYSIECAVQSELLRSRYTGNPVSVIAVHPNLKKIYDRIPSTELLQEIELEFGKQLVLTKITRNIRKNIRFIDELYHDEKTGRLIIVCPEMEQSEGHALSESIQQNIKNELGITPECSVSSFPDEAFTTDSLLENLLETRV